MTFDDALDAYFAAIQRRKMTPFPKDGQDREWRIYISHEAWDMIREHWEWTGPAPSGRSLLFGYPAAIAKDLRGTEIRIVHRT